MHADSRTTTALALAAAAALSGACSDAPDRGEVAASADPKSGSLLAADSVIVVTFEQSMDREVLLGGELGGSLEPSWSAGERADDTLTLRPAGGFRDGRDLSLRVEATSRTGATALVELAYDIDATVPTASATPSEVVRSDQPIAIRFSEAVDRARTALGGSLGAQAGEPRWSQAQGADVLTLPPATAWSSGRLSVEMRDLAGNRGSVDLGTYRIDDDAPSAEVSPPSGALLNARTPIALVFDEAVQPGSLELSGSLAGARPSREYGLQNRLLTLSPQGPWPNGPGSLGVIVRDRAGNRATIELAYEVDSVAPTASRQPIGRLRSDGAVIVRFSETMDPGSLSLGGSLSGEAGAPVWSGTSNPDDAVTIAPARRWGGDGSLTLDATDLAGNPVHADLGPYAIDDTPATAIAEPASGATLAPSQAIVLTFDERIDPASLALSGTLATGQGPTPQWRSVGGETYRALRLLGPWPGGAGLTLGVTVRDVAGNPLSIALSYDVDVTPAALTSATPTDHAYIGDGDAIVLTFDESIDVAAPFRVYGSLGDQSDGGAWSSTALANDTLTVSPATAWTPTQLEGALGVLVTDLYGNTSQFTLAYRVDTTPPELVSRTVADGEPLMTDQPLQFLFSEPIDPDSLTLGGSLAADVGSASWSPGSASGDRLTLTPASRWREGGGQTLIIDVSDPGGLPAAQVLSTHPVFDHVVYVHPAGDDGNPGTVDSPLASLVAAVDLLVGEYYPTPGFDGIRVAAGTYEGLLWVQRSLEIRGGYDPDDWSAEPDPASFETVIQTGPSDFATVYATAAAVTLRDLTIEGPSVGTVNAAQSVLATSAALSVRDCIVRGGTAGIGSITALAFTGDALEVIDSTIEAQGTAEELNTVNQRVTSETTALSVEGGSVAISGSTLDGGIGQLTTGLSLSGSGLDATVTDSAIHGGDPFAGDATAGAATAFSRGIAGAATGSIAIVGNTIRAGTTAHKGRGISLHGEAFGLVITIGKNRIDGGTLIGSDGAIEGIWLDGPATIRSNVIQALNPAAGTGMGIVLDSGAAAPAASSIVGNTITAYALDADVGGAAIQLVQPDATIEHNILVCKRRCIEEAAADADPLAVRFNAIVDLLGAPLGTASYLDADAACSAGESCELSELAGLADIPGGTDGNVALDPALDPDPVLASVNSLPTPASPCAVTRSSAGAAVTDAYGFSEDVESATRSAPWSMGAIEWDGSCQ